MRKVRFSVAMSVDGFIAGPKGESDWIVMDPDIDFRSLMKQFDTVLLGRRTYEAARSQGHAGGMPGMKAVVFSRTWQRSRAWAQARTDRGTSSHRHHQRAPASVDNSARVDAAGGWRDGRAQP